MSVRSWLCATVLATLCVSGASAVEQQRIEDVWPVGKRLQYLYYFQGTLIGDSWMEVRKIPKTRDRYEMMTTIDVDGVPHGSPMKITGFAKAELDPWGRPVSYQLELNRPQGQTTMDVILNFPTAEMEISEPDTFRVEAPRFHEESRLLDYVFIGPFDLAFRLDPINPSAERVRRNYFVPQLEVNVLTDCIVQYEELVTTAEGDEVPTVSVRLPALLTEVWLGPDGRVVKAEVDSEGLEILPGKIETP